MIIDEEAFGNSTFTLMASEDIASYSEDKEVLAILKKHDLLQSNEHMTNSKDILHITLVKHIENLYYLNKDIPQEFTQVTKNNNAFKMHLLDYVNKKIDSLLSDGSTIFFKEIISIINLLCLGEKFTIFKTYNDYDFNEISRLFRTYESLLQEQFTKNRYNFESTFECYLKLINAYSQLCIINATDVYRKKTINPVVNVIAETINMFKFTVPLDEEHLEKLNNVLGEILYFFSHLPYIDAKDKALYYLIDEFYLLLEKQTDGYHLSKGADFGGNKENQNSRFLTFLNNSGYLILTMLQKLKYTFRDKDYYKTRSFQKCLRLFSENFPVMHVVQKDESLESFNGKLLNSIVQSYQLSDSSFNVIINYQNVIDDFIQTADSFNIHNIETIHNVLLFADDIDDYKYLHIGETLVHSELIKNDYYEFFKLKTVDIIINYFIKNKSKENIISFIKQVDAYVQNNKKASHLLSMFSKLNLSMAHYYSTLDDESSAHKSKILYSIFINTNGEEILKNEYARINNDILVYLGKYYVKDLELNPENFDSTRLKKLGKKLSVSYIEHKDLELKYSINESITTITSEILNEDTIDYEDINNRISDIISNKIFYGLCEVRVKGLTRVHSRIEDNGFKLFSIPMVNEAYVLQFIFPAVYEKAFKHILKVNKTFISKNINNILSSFKNNTVSLTDETTGLENITKLRSDLEVYNNDDILFVEVLLGSLQKVNKTFGFKTGNIFLRSIGKNIKSLINKNDKMYYMNGGRFGIVLSSNNEHEVLTKKIQNFKIKKDGKNVNMNLTIAVTQSKSSKILDESARLLDKALTSKNKILINIK